LPGRRPALGGAPAERDLRHRRLRGDPGNADTQSLTVTDAQPIANANRRADGHTDAITNAEPIANTNRCSDGHADAITNTNRSANWHADANGHAD
jgi:hypothetical protein